MPIYFFFTQQFVRVLIHVATAHIIIGKVTAHKVILLSRRATDTAGLLHGGQVEPFIIVLVGIVIIPREKPRTFYVTGVLEEHNALAVFLSFAHVDGVRNQFALAHGSALINQFHHQFRLTGIAIGTVFYFLSNLSARLSHCRGGKSQYHQTC